MKFHENPCGRSRVVPCRQTDGWTDRQTDMTKLIVAFRNFEDASMNVKIEFWVTVFKNLLFTSFFCFILLLVPAIVFY